MKKFLAIIGYLVLNVTLSGTAEPRDLTTTQQNTEEFASEWRKLSQTQETKLESLTFDNEFFKSQLNKESRGIHIKEDGKLIESKAGALGIAQFMPNTWKWLKKKSILPKNFDIKNKEHQKQAQRIYMEYLYKYDYGTTELCQKELAIAAYNCGPGRVSREVKKHGKEWRKYVPNETKDYLNKLYQVN